MILNAIFLSNEKKVELEKELKKLKTKGREDITDKMARAREDLLSESDEELAAVLEEKGRLEARISEIENVLSRAVLPSAQCKLVADVGSEVVLVHEKNIIIYKLVSPIEVDPGKNMISVESEIGNRLKGLKVGNTVKIKNKDGVEIKYKVLYIC